jgi:pullulanase/glycogen debranching enzyme
VKGRQFFGRRDEFEKFETKLGSVFRGTFDFVSEPFDWGDDYARPEVPYNDLVIYETTVRVPTSPSPYYAGRTLKIDRGPVLMPLCPPNALS